MTARSPVCNYSGERCYTRGLHLDFQLPHLIGRGHSRVKGQFSGRGRDNELARGRRDPILLQVVDDTDATRVFGEQEETFSNVAVRRHCRVVVEPLHDFLEVRVHTNSSC